MALICVSLTFHLTASFRLQRSTRGPLETTTQLQPEAWSLWPLSMLRLARLNIQVNTHMCHCAALCHPDHQVMLLGRHTVVSVHRLVGNGGKSMEGNSLCSIYTATTLSEAWRWRPGFLVRLNNTKTVMLIWRTSYLLYLREHTAQCRCGLKHFSKPWKC